MCGGGDAVKIMGISRGGSRDLKEGGGVSRVFKFSDFIQSLP